jgi:AbrB family looped-hinge helix DNA binding protein
MANRSIDVPESSAPAALSRIGQRRQVVIPKSVFDALRLKEGDLVEVTTDQGRVSMKPKKPLDADDTLTLEESSKVRHALKQARAGNTRPWNDVKRDLGL